MGIKIDVVAHWQHRGEVPIDLQGPGPHDISMERLLDLHKIYDISFRRVSAIGIFAKHSPGPVDLLCLDDKGGGFRTR